MGTSAVKEMPNIELKNANIYFESSWSDRWAEDLQPPRDIDPSSKKPIDAEIRINQKLAALHQPELLKDIQELVREYAPDAIIDFSDPIKSFASAKRKIDTDENAGGTPRGIGDYLRIRVIVRGDDPAKAISQIEDLREQLMYDPQVTSYKDQFRVPCPEGGHRKFVANRKYGYGETALKAEIQICHEGMETGPHDDAIKAIRKCERELAPAVKTMQATMLSTHWAKNVKDMYYFMQEQRRAINNEQATICGLNVLLNPDIKHRHVFDAAASRGTNFKPHMASGFQVVERTLTHAANVLPEGSHAKNFMNKLIVDHGSAPTHRECN